jgi:hypothetical protein
LKSRPRSLAAKWCGRTKELSANQNCNDNRTRDIRA